MPLNATLHENLDSNDREYRVYTPLDPPGWLAYIASEYINLRTSCVMPLTELSYDGIQMSAAQLKLRIQRATVPHYVGGNFDVLRSDLGELIGYLLLEENFGTRFGFKSLMCRELIMRPARGIDGIGIENGPELTVVITEVKVSDSASSPPGVVDSGDDSLRKQHLKHIQNPKLVANQIWDKAREVADLELRALYFRAALGLENTQGVLPRVSLSSVLVRPAAKYKQTDFGSFRSSPQDYGVGHIRFLVFNVDGDIDTVVRELDKILSTPVN